MQTKINGKSNVQSIGRGAEHTIDIDHPTFRSTLASFRKNSTEKKMTYVVVGDTSHES